MRINKTITLTYAPGDFQRSKYYLKSLSADGSYAITKSKDKARGFVTQAMVEKAISHIQAAMCGIPASERPDIEVEA